MSPEKHSKFLRVICNDCDSEQIIFNKSNLQINCPVCGSTLAVQTGGKAQIKGKIIGVLDNAP
jgi:small subunit ribosomal protein S27e